MSEGQVDESCLAESPGVKEKQKVMMHNNNEEEAMMKPRNLQVPNATSKLRGIGIVN